MANLKNITDLPIIESADGVNLIVNDNGSAKQIAAGAVGAQADFNVTDENHPAFIKNKPTVVQSDWSVEDESNPAYIKNKHTIKKELMYEWNFNAEDEVYEVFENVDEDLTWLIPPSNGSDFEIVMTGCAYFYDDDNCIIVPDKSMTVSGNSLKARSAYIEGVPGYTMVSSGWSESPWITYDETNGYEFHVSCYWDVYSNVHIDYDNGTMTPVDVGGTILIGSDSDAPITSIKIYKITK